jgi:hypothetical protein
VHAHISGRETGAAWALRCVSSARRAERKQKSDISLDTYKLYFTQIELQIIPKKVDDLKGTKFVNIKDFDNNKVYFNFDIKEIKRDYFIENDDVSKIRVLVDIKNKESLSGLFSSCKYIF